MTQKILVVEDDREVAELVKLHLCAIGCTVRIASDGETALLEAEEAHWHLVILDVLLPGCDGIEVCSRLRARADYVPILMLTACADTAKRVLALELGADDYLVKPFAVLELIARVRAILRRVQVLTAGSAGEPDLLRAGRVLIDRARHSVTVEGRAVELTAKEFELLWHLASHPGRVFTREQLLDEVWSYQHIGYQHTVNSHINRLRTKLERNPGRPEHILTVWGVGYKFNEVKSIEASPAVGRDAAMPA